MKSKVLIVLIALAAAAVPLAGHHASYFDPQEIIVVTGKVSGVQWTNPHAYLLIDSMHPDGQIQRWTVEGRSPNQLLRAGWTQQTIHIGEEITVTGRPPRADSRLAEMGPFFIGAGPVRLAGGETMRFGPLDIPAK